MQTSVEKVNVQSILGNWPEDSRNPNLTRISAVRRRVNQNGQTRGMISIEVKKTSTFIGKPNRK